MMNRRLAACVTGFALVAGVLATAGTSLSVLAATQSQVNLKVLLIGGVGGAASDPMTAAWDSTLTNEGVPYTEVDASGAVGSETVALPTLSSGTSGYYNGVVTADAPADFAAGQLTALDSYESTFGVRQLDGYVYPTSSLGETDVSGSALDGTTGELTSAGLTAFSELAGPVPFDTGTWGYPASVVAGAPFTPLIENAARNVLGGVYLHPSTDAQAGVSELVLNFDYNAAQLQWLLLGPSLINWVTQDTHLGLYRNYIEMDIDDVFTPDDVWDTANDTIDYSDADAVRMTPADVTYAAQWEAANNFRFDMLYNGGGSVDEQADSANGSDPLLAQFQADDPKTGKPYADDFGWLSHTYDTPYLDVGCATQDYIEAELNENSSWAAEAPGGTPGTGGLGLTESTDTSAALGYENPDVFVPGNHSGFANLEPGNPATVDPPDLDDTTLSTGGQLAAGEYAYAVTDQFVASTGTPTSANPQSQADVTDVTVTSGQAVQLNWESICHAAQYNIYRTTAPGGAINATGWAYLGSVSTPFSATLPDNSSGGTTSTTNVTGEGETEQDYVDSGAKGAAVAAAVADPAQESALETPWEQNPYFIPALEAVGITAVGDDASKAYPDPSTDEFGIGTAYTGAEYAAGQSFVDGTAQVVPRHPNDIYYDAATDAEETSEFDFLNAGTAYGSYDFAQIVGFEDSSLLQQILGNDPRPNYVHQTNIIGSPSDGASASDGTLYSVLNPLLTEYHSYISSSAPYQQLTLGAIATTLADQSAWAATAAAGSVTASEAGGVVTLSDTGSGAATVPLTVPEGTTVETAGGQQAFGQTYGGTLSGWVPLAGGATETLTTPAAGVSISSAATATATAGTAFSFTVTTAGSPAPSLAETGLLPSGLTFVDNGNGTATLAGTPAAGSGGSYAVTLSATSSAGTTSQSFTLTVDQSPTLSSAVSATAAVGTAFTFNITTSGYPAPSVLESGALASGVTFAAGSGGTATLSGTPATGSGGSYPVTFAATNSAGTSTQSFTLTVDQSPAITSAASTTATVGSAFNFNFTTSGYPAPTVAASGSLPSGVTFASNGNGTATLSGNPAAGTTGTYPITIQAASGVGSPASQSFTLTVVPASSAPVISSSPSTSGTTGVGFSFSVTASGSPAPSLTESGTLPSGLTFVDSGNGVATLSGTPAAGSGGSYALTLTASNSAGTYVQSFTLTVDQGPAMTSASSATATAGSAFSFGFTSSGYPAPAITESGTLPSGVTFADLVAGTATLSGTAAAGGAGSYPLTITATNSAGQAVQTFTLVVDLAPGFTSAASAIASTGKAFSFEVTTSGYPAPALTVSGTLPAGISFAAGTNGTATLSGTPGASAGGSYPVNITATSGAGSVVQAFTLVVDQAPTFTSAASATATAGKAFSFSVTTSGYPAAAITEAGTLPAGVTLVSNGNGTATLGGTPTASAAGSYPVVLTATSTAGSGSQRLLLTVAKVNAAPTITSVASATATVGTAFSFTFTATGTPVPTVSHTGNLPRGLTFTAGSNGVATLAGTPASGTTGTYQLRITATNSAGSARQSFTLTVRRAPPGTRTAPTTGAGRRTLRP
jgi:hypothetical protein